MALDPRLLRSFVVLAEELHYGRAAQRLGVAQPALSQQIGRLELQVGARLFVRNSRVVELTDGGRAMLEPARTALRSTEQAERAARGASRTSAHPLRVGISFCLDDLVPAVAAHASTHPEIQLMVSRLHERQGHEMLAAGCIDAFVGDLASAAGHSTSSARGVEIPLLALASPDHVIARQPAVRLSAFRQSPIAMSPREWGPEQFDYFVDLFSEGAGRQLLAIHESKPTGTGTPEQLFKEIRAGRAVGFGSPATLAAHAGALRCLPFDPPLSFPTSISWQDEGSLFVDELVASLSVA